MPIAEPGAGQAGGVGAAPRGGDDRLLAIGLAGLLVVGDAAPGQDLGQAPVHHLDLAEGPTMTLEGLRSRWITPRAWA